MTPSSGATLENTGLLRYKLDQMVKELQHHHRAFSLRYTVQWSAAQTEAGRKSFMCFAFTCLPSNPRAEIQLGVGWGQNILLHRGCIIDGEKPTWSFRQPLSQLAVETEEEKPTADTLCPVLFLTIEFLAEGRSLEKNVICSCIPEVTEKLKHKMKSSKALGPHFNSNYYQNCQTIQEQSNKGNQNDRTFFLFNKTLISHAMYFILCIIILSLFFYIL